MSKIVFLDIETTGLDPQTHEILEVAMIVREDGHDKEVYFSQPISLASADPKALEVNRYSRRVPELVKAAIPRPRALALFEVYLRDAVVVGNNIQFDLRFIEEFIYNHGNSQDGTRPWHYHPIDLKALVAGRCGLGEPPWRTPDIAAAIGVPLPSDAHEAMADARWNRDVYDALYAGEAA